MMRVCLALALFIGLQQVVTAQQSSSNPSLSTTPAGTAISAAATLSSVSHADDRYRVGPGDVLDIRVFNKPQFSRDAVRVDSRGMIRMPLIEGEIQAACRTEEELAREITTRYLEFLRQPQVDVFIKEYESQPVAVLGAVRAPSRFQLHRRARLLELLSFVGGSTDNAGGIVQIVHTASPSVCEASVQGGSDEASVNVLDNFKLVDTLRGDEKANPYVRPGDVISVTEAEQAFVVGNVLKPSAIPLKGRITVSRAIAMCGGTMPDTRSDRVRIVRQPPGSMTKTEIFVNLKAIDKQREDDVALQAGDIVDVPSHGGKKLLRSLLGAVVPSIGQLPVRVIP